MSIEQYRPPEGVDFHEWMTATSYDDCIASTMQTDNDFVESSKSKQPNEENQLHDKEKLRIANDPLYELI